MDFFTFIVIAVFIYGIFSKKDKPPQRRQSTSEDRIPPMPMTQTPKPIMQTGKKKESIFETLERQIRESAEKLEQELQGGKTLPPKPVAAEAGPRKYKPNTPLNTSKPKSTEGTWGDEGRSDYDKYSSNQGTQGNEGLQGQEGGLGNEGAWGTEGGYYAQKQNERAGGIGHSEIGAGSGHPGQRAAVALAFSQSDVVNGIIWAEVLKEPKGRRGFSRR